MRRRVAQFYVESVAWGTGHADGHLLTRCVLHRVGEIFLDDPVRRTSHAVRQWAGGIEREIDRETRLAGALDQLRQVRERRLRELAHRSPQYADHLAKILQRLVRAGPDDLGGPGNLLGGRVRAISERARVRKRSPGPSGLSGYRSRFLELLRSTVGCRA
jgi:hypothetical protein